MIRNFVNTIFPYYGVCCLISWCATMIIGPPKVYPDYGDKPGAWAQGVINDSQFIEVKFYCLLLQLIL